MVSPLLAINSSGRYNRFNHPAEEVLNRYQSRDMLWLDTQSHGLITVTFGERLNARALLHERPAIWRKKSPENRAFTTLFAEGISLDTLDKVDMPIGIPIQSKIATVIITSCIGRRRSWDGRRHDTRIR